MAKTPKEGEELPNPVINRGIGLTKPALGDADFIPEDEKLDGIDLVKINQIISSEDVQKGGFIRLERRGPYDQKFQYVTKIEPDNFDIDQIKKLYGGGDYQGRTFRANGQMYKMFTFSVDHRYKGAMDEDQIKALAAQDSKNGSDVQNRLLEVALGKTPQPLENNPSFMARLMEIIGAPKKDDNMPMMLAMIQQMQSQSAQSMQIMMTAMQESNKMMIAVLTAGKATGPDASLAVLMEVLKEKATADPVEKMMKLMGQAKELVAGAPPEKEPSMLQQIVAGAAPAVAGLFMGGKHPPLPPTEVIDRGQIQTQPQPLSPEQMNGIAIRMFLSQVLGAASRNSDPGIYVDMIFDNLNEANLMELKGRLTDAAWPVNVFGDDARAVQFRPWLENLKRMILEDLQNATNDPQAGDSDKGGQPVSLDGPTGG